MADNKRARTWRDLVKALQEMDARKHRWILARFNVSSDRFEVLKTKERYRELDEDAQQERIRVSNRKSSFNSSVLSTPDLHSVQESKNRRRDDLVEFLSVPLLYSVAEFLGPWELTALGAVSSFWYKLTRSEMLWMALCYRLQIFGYGDWQSVKYQVRAFVEGAPEGRGWRNACMIGLAFQQFLACFPDNLNCYGIFDFEHTPSQGVSARKKPGRELLEPPPAARRADRPVALLVWDPEGFPVPRRRPQLGHFRKINSLHEHIPWVTHVFHFRRKEDIKLQALLQKLAYRCGRPEDLMREEAAWGLPPMFRKDAPRKAGGAAKEGGLGLGGGGGGGALSALLARRVAGTQKGGGAAGAGDRREGGRDEEEEEEEAVVVVRQTRIARRSVANILETMK